MKLWIIVGIIVAALLGLWLFTEGGVLIKNDPESVSTTTEDELSEKNENGEDEESSFTMVEIALIALEDNGATGKKIGCNDSVVLVNQQVEKTTAPLRAALLHLLSIDDATYGESGLYTALADADLELTDVQIEEGEATIELEGELSLGGVCDSPRVQAQLVETALQFPTVNTVTVLLNGEPLEEALSEM